MGVGGGGKGEGKAVTNQLTFKKKTNSYLMFCVHSCCHFSVLLPLCLCVIGLLLSLWFIIIISYCYHHYHHHYRHYFLLSQKPCNCYNYRCYGYGLCNYFIKPVLSY